MKTQLAPARIPRTWLGAVAWWCAVGGLMAAPRLAADERENFALQLRYQRETSEGSGRYHRLTRDETWNPRETAVIVCDVWDLHHCLNAVRRVKQLAPRLNELLRQARRQGATIIHAPSDCMEAYADHPARRRALDTPVAQTLPPEIRAWCSRIPAEEQGEYPIDQSDGGEDDDPQEHAAWEAELKSLGRNPSAPWKKQYDVIQIDPRRDYISDRGDEVWSILEQRGIKNVILTGVHTNMCVLGRPFGLRQMARNGKNVVLMRDLTDTMYNPQRWPYVSHFTGTDLIVAHIEKFVCPTVTSDQLLGGQPLRFAGDRRPHLVMVIAEDEYRTNETLPKFAVSHLGKDFRVSFVHGSETERHDIPGLEVLDDADLALFSVRRRRLPERQMQFVRRFVESGKPVIGIRTASHAFEVRNEAAPEGYREWPEFDRVVFGGNYHGHYPNQLKSRVTVVEDAAEHPILERFTPKPFPQGGSLYQTSPLAEGTTVLLSGKAEGHPAEPVAWTYKRADGGRSFYTSLGHVKDFENSEFLGFFQAAIRWAAGLPAADSSSPEKDATSQREAATRHWTLVRIPAADGGDASLSAKGASVVHSNQPVWLRCAVRLPAEWLEHEVRVEWNSDTARPALWCNGQAVSPDAGPSDAASPGAASPDAGATGSGMPFGWTLKAEWLQADDANLLVVRLPAPVAALPREAPRVTAGPHQLPLAGRWQFRAGNDPAWSNMPLPAKFGAATDIVFQP